MRHGFRLALVLLASMSAAGCAPLLVGPQTYGRPRAAMVQPLPPVGRWDLVMSLQPSWLIAVIEANGTTHTGRFLAADGDGLSVVVRGSEISVPRVEVMRVDLVQTLPAGARTGKRIAAGAAAGSLAMVAALQIVPLAFAGKLWMPPAKVWVAGAALGAGDAALRDAAERYPRTIYVAPMHPIY